MFQRIKVYIKRRPKNSASKEIVDLSAFSALKAWAFLPQAPLAFLCDLNLKPSQIFQKPIIGPNAYSFKTFYVTNSLHPPMIKFNQLSEINGE